MAVTLIVITDQIRHIKVNEREIHKKINEEV